jgi:multidrug efflux pump subunit AcrB
VIPLEEEINGVEGMTYMASTASEMTVLQIFLFTLDWEQIPISLR